MKEIIYNYDYLTDEDITETVIRIKALIINNGTILIGDENQVFQFPGGHLEKGESFNECLKREILEETGIEIDDNEIEKPLMKVTYLNKDWPEKVRIEKTKYIFMWLTPIRNPIYQKQIILKMK